MPDARTSRPVARDGPRQSPAPFILAGGSLGAVELPRRIARLFAPDSRSSGFGPRLTAVVVEVHDGCGEETKKQNLPRGRSV